MWGRSSIIRVRGEFAGLTNNCSCALTALSGALCGRASGQNECVGDSSPVLYYHVLFDAEPVYERSRGRYGAWPDLLAN